MKAGKGFHLMVARERNNSLRGLSRDFRLLTSSALLLFLSACSSGGEETDAGPSLPNLVLSGPTVVVSSAMTSPGNLSPIPVDVVFSEDVSDFEVSDLLLVNGAASNFSGSGSAYSFDLTPSADGIVSVSLPPAIATSIAAGEPNQASAQFDFVYDTTGATPTLSSSASTTTNDSPILISVQFGEVVSGFDLSDVSIGNGTAGNFLGSGATYTFEVTPGVDGAVTVDIPAGGSIDEASNLSLAATQLSLTYDSTAPTVTLSSTESTPTSVTPIPMTITFSESVTGLTESDFSVANGTVSNLSGSGTTYTLDLFPSANGIVTVDLAGNSASDAAGNGNVAAPQFAITYDSSNPAVTLSSTASDPTNGSPIPVTVTFSKPVLNFVVGDLILANGSASNFTGSGATYTFDLTPTGQGSVTVDVAAGVANDAGGNLNTAAGQFSRIYDSIAPDLVLSASASDPTSSSPITVTFSFSEAVSGFSLGDISVGNGSVTNLSGSGATYTADIVPSANGLVTVDVAGGVASDTAGNANNVATQLTRTYDGTAPTVVISSSASDPTNTSPIPVTVTFSESVTGFDLSDVVLGNGVGSNFSGSGATYTFDLTPSADGSVTVDVPSDSGVDSAGNGNDAATQFSLLYDSTAPTLVISSTASNPTSASPIAVTVVFSEVVTGFAMTDLVIGNGAVSNFSGSGSSYSFDLTPSAGGAVTVDVAADSAADSAGNGNIVAPQFSLTYQPPVTVSISSGETNPTSASPFIVSITFSEAVTGFVVGDLVVGNGTFSDFVDVNGEIYTVKVTPSGDGLVTVDVPSGVAQNGSAELNQAATQFQITYNSNVPSAPSGLALNNPIASPDTDTTPEVTVLGVESGDTVRIYSDIACTNLIGTAVSAGTSVDITSSTLAIGDHTIFATRENVTAESECSSAFVSYTVMTSYLQVDDLAALGNWTQAGDDNHDWTINTGGTPSSGVGPTDAADAGGSYAYTEASNPVAANEVFSLVSNSLDAGANSLIFDFKYNKRGDFMGDLFVEVSTDDGTTWDTPVWSHLGTDIARNNTDVWRDASVNLCSAGYNSGNIRVRMRAVMPSSGTIWNSDVAIDTLAFRTGPCVGLAITSPTESSAFIGSQNQAAYPVSGTCTENGENVTISGATTGVASCVGGVWSTSLNFTSVPDGPVLIQAAHSDAGATTTAVRMLNLTKDASVIQRDNFTTDLGTWSQVGTDQRDWTRTSGGTPSNGIGPTDAADAGGSYLYTEASSPVAANDTFILQSQTYVATGVNLGMEFRWNKRGDNMGDLYIEVSTDGGSTWDAPVWSHLGADVATSGSDVWNTSTVNLCSAGYSSGNVMVRFRAVMPASAPIWNSDIAIDEIVFRDEPTCP